MSQVQSYYELLGVSRTATAEEIRAAYVRLMKLHHPDAAARCDGAPDLAPLLNRCYAVLKDPVLRSQHDAQRLDSSPVPLMPRHLHQPGPRRRQRRAGSVLVLVGVGALAFSWVAVDLVGQGTTAQELAATDAQWMPRASAMASRGALPLPNAPVIQRIAERARTLSIRGAENFSRRCFTSARRQQNPGSADTCVLFDAAFLYWRKIPASTSTFPAYFADQVVDYRHKELAIVYGSNADERLVALREVAFQALIQGLQGLPHDPATSLQVRDHTLTQPELREGEQRRLAEANVP